MIKTIERNNFDKTLQLATSIELPTRPYLATAHKRHLANSYDNCFLLGRLIISFNFLNINLYIFIRVSAKFIYTYFKCLLSY